MSNKEENSQSFPLSSLPDELVLSCLARLSKSDYAALSLVSKRYHSLVVSPELYKTRLLLGYTKKRLYVCLRNGYNLTPIWSILSGEKAVNQRYNSTPLQPFAGSSVVALDREIYVIGGWIKGKPASSDVLLLDCRTHTWRILPSMGVGRAYAAAGVIDGKIYVFGGCDDSDSSNWGEVFDPKTQTWDTLVPLPDPNIRLEWIDASLVIKKKLFAVENGEAQSKCLYYSASEGKWGRRNLDTKPYLKRNQYVMIEKVLYSLDDSRKLFWCEKEEFKWKEVKGLDIGELFGSKPPFDYSLSNFGDNIVVFWRWDENSKFWCAEISLERRKEGDEIWGKVEWSDVVIKFDYALSLSILYSVSVNL